MNVRKGSTIMVAVSMVLAFAFTTDARSFGPGLKGGGMRAGLRGLRAFLELKLSDAQQVEMMNIINKYRDEREGLRDGMMEARKNLLAVLRAEPFNEEGAREAFRKASSVREEMFILRAKMISELKTILTPEQQELLKERRAQRLERFKKRFETWAENP